MTFSQFSFLFLLVIAILQSPPDKVEPPIFFPNGINLPIIGGLLVSSLFFQVYSALPVRAPVVPTSRQFPLFFFEGPTPFLISGSSIPRRADLFLMKSGTFPLLPVFFLLGLFFPFG